MSYEKTTFVCMRGIVLHCQENGHQIYSERLGRVHGQKITHANSKKITSSM